MQHLEKIIDTLRCFHYATDLPIWLFENNELISCFPNNIITASLLIESKVIIPDYSKKDKDIQITQNKYRETMILQNINSNSCVIIGPFLTEAIESGTLTNMVREGIIPFHQKTKMSDYYHECLLINDTKLNYLVKFINKLYKENKNRDLKNDIDDIDVEFEDESFYKQKSEYRKNKFIHSSYSIEQEISKTISNGDVENTKRILKEINLTPHAKLASTMLRSYKNSMIASCTFMTRACIIGGVNPDEAFTLSDTYINRIENILTVKELEKFESIMAEGFAEKVKSVKSQSFSPAILNTIYYIDNHLCDDIDITTLARQVYLNPSYLSTLFHQETGITISEWINRKRIEEAAHFVKNTNDDIADIAFFYHFCSQSYFVQVFKKIIGVTPGEYRKKGIQK